MFVLYIPKPESRNRQRPRHVAPVWNAEALEVEADVVEGARRQSIAKTYRVAKVALRRSTHKLVQ